MKPISALATCAALPVVVLGLTGAATVPEPQMYAGAMTTLQSVSGSCAPLADSQVTGHWSARMNGSGVAIVHIKIKLNGKAHANWSMPFTVTSSDADAFTAVLVRDFGAYGTDTLTVTLLPDGTFTYDLDAESIDCQATFVGTLGQ